MKKAERICGQVIQQEIQEEIRQDERSTKWKLRSISRGKKH